MTDTANIICPECEAENKHDAKRCAKCEYPLAAEKDFERLVSAARKKREKNKKATEPVVEEKKGFFDVLG